MPFENSKKEGETIRDIALKEQEDVARILAARYGFSYANLTASAIDPSALILIPEQSAIKARLVAFLKEGKNIHVATEKADSDDIRETLLGLEELGYNAVRYLVSPRSIDKGLARYEDLRSSTSVQQGEVDINPIRIAELRDQVKVIADISPLLSSAEKEMAGHRLTQVLEIILASSLSLDVSDIHLEPEGDGARIRFRVDGVLRDVGHLPSNTYRFLTSRVKLMSGVKLNIHNKPQDGRFSIKVLDKSVEVRVSVIPDADGESLVLRVLNPEKANLGLENLGMPEALITRIREEIRRPNGMILTTGPTGSGKTTALYALMREVYSPDIKIITIENPIEYRLPGITQTQIDGEVATFGGNLRAALRQDPDLIMVGEIRDEDVAKTAINAALTGHMVLSTLHTNSAAGTFPRLIDLGIAPDVIGSAVILVIGQRLIRTLKKGAGKQVPLEGKLKDQLLKIVKGIVNTDIVPPIPEFIYEGEDDDFKGRVGVYEFIYVDSALATFLRTNPSVFDIEAYIKKTQGMLTMMEDGVLKVLKGETSIAELERVVGPIPK